MREIDDIGLMHDKGRRCWAIADGVDCCGEAGATIPFISARAIVQNQFRDLMSMRGGCACRGWEIDPEILRRGWGKGDEALRDAAVR